MRRYGACLEATGARFCQGKIRPREHAAAVFSMCFVRQKLDPARSRCMLKSFNVAGRCFGTPAEAGMNHGGS